MFNVASILAIAMKRLSSAKYLPGQILREHTERMASRRMSTYTCLLPKPNAIPRGLILSLVHASRS